MKWPWQRRDTPPAPPPPVRKCRVEEDDQDQGGTYRCTLRWGHGGLNHEAWISGRCVYRWRR
jgi:hypothetical protein